MTLARPEATTCRTGRPGAHIDLRPRRRPGPAVLPVRTTPATPTPGTVAVLRDARQSAAARRACTSCWPRATVARPRPPQPLPGRRRAALPVRRRRHRHHAAAADDRRGRGGRRRLGAALRRAHARPRWPSSTELAAYGDRVHLVPEDELRPARPRRASSATRGPTPWSTRAAPRGCSAAVEERLLRPGPTGGLHLERFAARKSERRPGASVVRAGAGSGSGVTLEVPPDRSVFDVIQDAGVSVLGSCHEGICGTCEQGSSRARSTTATRCSTRASGRRTK